MTQNKEIVLNQFQNMDNTAKVTHILAKDPLVPKESKMAFRGQIWLYSIRLYPEGQYYFNMYSIISLTFS